MSFSEDAWRDIEQIYAAILDHPFMTELADGSLAKERFVFYMQQDSLYLQAFPRALAIAGARAPEVEEMKAFLDFATGCIVVERRLHESYFVQFEAPPATEMAPACFAYSSYLLAQASLTSYAEAVASLLPCFWIYREVGLHIYKGHEAEGNPYSRWIETYAGEGFIEAVDRAIAIVDAAAEKASPDERHRMLEAFRRASRLEWMFWDNAYRLEQWPP